MKTLAIKALAAASLSLLAVAPAAAEEVHITVHYGDLDIASPEGARVLASRLQNAAKRVCRPDRHYHGYFAAWNECRDAAFAAAVAQLAQRGRTLEGVDLAGL